LLSQPSYVDLSPFFHYSQFIKKNKKKILCECVCPTLIEQSQKVENISSFLSSRDGPFGEMCLIKLVFSTENFLLIFPLFPIYIYINCSELADRNPLFVGYISEREYGCGGIWIDPDV
jgi:hypothetical protein